MTDKPEQRKIPKARLVRALRPAVTAATAAAAQGGTWARTRVSGDADDKQRRQVDRAIKSAQQVAELMGEMKGAFMKVGQLLSFADSGVLPPEVRNVLAQLQADAPPMAYELVAEVVEAELGRPPDKAFDWFSPAPMASASIGQVHAARIGDDELVVKVQYPGVADAVAADLNNAGLMAAAVSLVQPLARQYMGRSDIKALAEEVRDRVLEELDYLGEARNQRLFADLYRGHPTIRIPEVVDDRSTARVLTSAYHDGMRWAAAVEQPKELRDRWAEVVYRFVFGTLYQYGIANADPHPGNYLFHEDGSVTFLDFGCVKHVPEDQIATMAEMGVSIMNDDVGAMTNAFRKAGFFARDVDLSTFYAAVRPAYLPLLEEQPFTFSVEASRKMLEASIGTADEYRSIARGVALPKDYLFLGRVGIGCHAILTGLEATNDWRGIMEEIWQVGAAPDTAAS